MVEGRLFVDAHPEAAQFRPTAEMADPGQADGEARRPDSSQGRVDVVELGAVDLTDEAERDVEALRLDPARARQAAGEQAQLPALVLGQGEGDEKTHGGKAPAANRELESSRFDPAQG